MVGNAIGPEPPNADGPQAGAAVFNPFDPRIYPDLYVHLRRLRETDPVHFQPSMGAWLVTEYADVAQVFADASFTKEGPAAKFLIGQYGNVGERMLDRQLFFLDPPDHTRLRSLVARAFTPRRVEGLRPRVEQVVGDLVDATLERGGLDVVSQFAFRIPIRALAGLFAIPEEDCLLVERWGLALFLSIGSQDPEVLAAACDTLQDLHDYFTHHVEQRRGGRGDTLLDALLDGVDAGQLSVEELVQMCMQLTAAGGYDTTSNLIASGLWVLLQHPEEYDRLRRDRSLLDNAVEELCRYEPPGQLLLRSAREDVVLPSGGRIPGGALVGALVGAANRDPAQFPDPDRLDLGRSNSNRHLGFGHGIHYCIGAPPARLIASVAITAVLDRMPGLTPLDETPQWRPTFVTRGLARFPAAVGRRG
jgi:pimeloyl-[acyl-carrier protein] synthase